ncbi:hypothetical protein Leryth_007356 [Lithospermum erythrorhizon]|nr:hypothetical protein Leryth_007356 [Lithospermum erythrorhizon]
MQLPENQFVNQHPPPAGYPTDGNIPTGKKKNFWSRSKTKGERGFIEGWLPRTSNMLSTATSILTEEADIVCTCWKI